MHIAIVGAGFSGLAIAWHALQQNPQAKITIFDPKGIGGGASGMAAGLLHPFSGAHAKLNRWGWEGMEATLELLNVASKKLKLPVYSQLGLFRLATTEMQVRDFLECLKKNPLETHWIESADSQKLIPGITSFPALFIKKGISVYCKIYLEGLWRCCQDKGAQLIKKKIGSLQELTHFDKVFITTGANTTEINELTALPLNKIKGQLLEIEWPSHLPPLSYPINSHSYISMDQTLKKCIVGATFERNFSTDNPEIEVAKSDILPKVSLIFPDLAKSPIIRCQAGVRAVTPNKLPLVDQIVPNTWILVGMGSKGLLYHALMAKKIVGMAFGVLESNYSDISL
jgi:glycine/D-amino acid oxidase-like deaminating enzyme